MRVSIIFFVILMQPCLAAEQQVNLWPEFAPGETTVQPGEQLPPRPGENPPATRVVNISRPALDVFLCSSEQPTAGIIILPGGGFGKIVTDKEGSEAALWLNELGISAFVVRYRTTPAGEHRWRKPVQDAQRALRIVRSRAEEWRIDAYRVGVLGFSAGGQVAAVFSTAESSHYPAADAVDRFSARPDFTLLIYPWQVLDQDGELISPIRITAKSPPTFLVHTHDDDSTSLGAVAIYAQLKKHGVPAELHIYQSGGHGYGMRPVTDSDIHTWPDRAADWLMRRKIARAAYGQ